MGENLPDRFWSHAVGDDAEKLAHVRGTLRETMEILQELVPAGRELSIVATKLEEAMFWANAGIARQHPRSTD